MHCEMASLSEPTITIKEEFEFVEVPEDTLVEPNQEIQSENLLIICSFEDVESPSDHTHANKQKVPERFESTRRGKRYCCVPNCHNREGSPSKNTGAKVTHYRFSEKFPEQTKLWVKAINKHIPTRKMWRPKISSRICSEHFLGNKKSVDPDSPSYIPTIFPNDYRNRPTGADLARYKRRIERRNQRDRMLGDLQSKHIMETETVLQSEKTVQSAGDFQQNLLKAQSEVIAQPKQDDPQEPVRSGSPFKIMLEYGTQTPKHWLKELIRGSPIPAMTNQATQTDHKELVSISTMTQ